jgi:membrane associated rhomboid family serine protease
MPEAPDSRYAFLYGTQRAEMVPLLERALERAGIPYHSGLLADPEPHIVFTVPQGRLEEARLLVDAYAKSYPEPRRDRPVVPPFLTDDVEEADEEEIERAWEEARAEEERERRRATFPKGPVQAAAALVLVHLAILFGLVGRDAGAPHMAALGGLVRGEEAIEPWRFVTSLFLHADLRHVVWNAFSFVVFAVPAILAWGYGGAALLYLVAGIGGGIAALLSHPAGTVIVGSSGAVAGLFGAWLAATLRKALRAPMTRRAVIRAVGIGLLVLPSLLTPTTAEGRRISVAAHLGGLLAGAAAAYVLELRRERGTIH